MTVQEFAKQYDTFEKKKPYKDYIVWRVSQSNWGNAKIGKPLYVLEKNGVFRFAELSKETYEIMKAQRA